MHNYLSTRYLIVRLDRKTVSHGGKRAVIICREGDEEFITFLSPSYNESKKFNSLDFLFKKSKPYKLYVSLEDIVEDKDMKIPIYNFLLKNPSTKDRIVVPCNFYPSSESIQHERELLQREKREIKEAEEAIMELEGLDDDELKSEDEKMESEDDAGKESEENDANDEEDDDVIEIEPKKMKVNSPKTQTKKFSSVKSVSKNSSAQKKK